MTLMTKGFSFAMHHRINNNHSINQSKQIQEHFNMKAISILFIAAIMLLGSSLHAFAKTDNEARNIKTVKNIYVGCMNNNMAPLYNNLASSYTWRTQTSADFHPVVSDYDNDAAGYYASIPYTVENFTVDSITSNTNQVVGIVRLKFKNPTTGKSDDTRLSEVWTFNSNGKITGYLQFRDTAALLDTCLTGNTQYYLAKFATEDIRKFNTGNPDLAYDDYDADAVISVNKEEGITVAQAKQDFAEAIASFPNLNYEILSITPGGDRVIIQLKTTGTFSGKPYKGIQPTGKSFTLYSTVLETVINGKIVDEDEDYDPTPLAEIIA